MTAKCHMYSKLYPNMFCCIVRKILTIYRTAFLHGMSIKIPQQPALFVRSTMYRYMPYR